MMRCTEPVEFAVALDFFFWFEVLQCIFSKITSVSATLFDSASQVRIVINFIIKTYLQMGWIKSKQGGSKITINPTIFFN